MHCTLTRTLTRTLHTLAARTHKPAALTQLLTRAALTQRLTFSPPHRTLRMSTPTAYKGPVQTVMEQKLTEQLKPSFLEILNESTGHGVPLSAESHFKVLIVCEQFTSMPLIARHRLVNTVLSEELKQRVHALSIVAKTPAQWNEQVAQQARTDSPACLGGSKHEAKLKAEREKQQQQQQQTQQQS